VNVIDWLLDSDPAVRWQVLRDLADADPTAVAAARARVAREGIGATLLARQDPDGAWSCTGEPAWFPTLYSLLLLRLTGIDPTDPAAESAAARVATGFRWHEDLGGKTFFEGETEPCINGGTLALGGYFGRPVAALAERLVGEQLADGGWNCDAPTSTRSSYHSTICVLEGLLEYERAAGPCPDVTAARRRGEAYLLDRSMFRRLSTGEPAHAAFTQLAFPPRYYYDILRGLDYFRAANLPPDPRASDAIRVLRDRRQPDGRWLLDATHADGIDFPLDESVGEPSRWITLRALRILRWYDATWQR
jgi:hypothetical protein